MTGSDSASSASAAGAPAPVIPVQLRVGGAFIVLAAVLALMVFVAVLTDGWLAPFEWTPARLMLPIAALIVGGFATTRRDQRASAAQVIALAVAVLLIIASRLLPTTVLATMSQPMVLIYASVALVCAVILRRSASSPQR